MGTDGRPLTTRVLAEPCAECGALVEPGAYHPYPFCVWQKAHLNPWDTFRFMALQMGLADPGEAPPKVWEIVASHE